MIENAPTYLQGLPLFLAYFSCSVLLTVVFAFTYHKITPHHEWALIRANKPAAAIAFGGSVIGFVLPLASAITHSVNLVDCVLWGVIAFAVQLATFFGLRLCIKDLPERITNNELSSGIFVAAASISAGILNAACMTS